jgi:hypothetical protein
MAAVVIAIALSPAVLLRAQDTTTRHSIAKDWITHHVVFSNPGTREQAIQNGTYDRWLRIVNDPRYIMQQEERSLMASTPSAASADAATDDGDDGDSEPAPAYNGPLPHGLANALIPPPPNMAVPEAGRPPHHRLKKDWNETLGSGGTTGLGEFPATFTTASASCSDFAIYNTGLAGSSSQASIVAYNNLYSTCTGNVPSLTWAYNTGGTIVNSIAFDVISCTSVCTQTGTQGYFVQTVGTSAQLVLLKWTAGSGTLTSPTTLSTTAVGSYSSCTAPCMTAITLSGSPSDTYSAPYYDPITDTIYVGDDVGKLHKFSPVFATGSTPAEVTTGGWPATVNANASLGSPVYDVGTTNVYASPTRAQRSRRAATSTPSRPREPLSASRKSWTTTTASSTARL